jgi:hypothetical protein
MKISIALLKIIPILILALPTHIASAESGQGIPGDEGMFDAALSDAMLEDQRGMAMVVNTNDMDAAVHGNTANDVFTGYNMVSDGSLTNNAGMNTVIQNSGNNVLIQNAVILNIQMQ